MMNPKIQTGFWREALAIHGSVTPFVTPLVLSFGAIATVIVYGARWVEQTYAMDVGMEVAHYELVGAALGLILVLRTNAGYDRWWEGRILWGGIVNQSRNLAISGAAFGPDDSDWQQRFIQWAEVFPHVSRCSLRGVGPTSEIRKILGDQPTEELAAADHMPSLVALKLADLLQEATDRHGMDRFAFIQIDHQRARLIDHIGGCERILKTPLPIIYSIKIRRFILIFLVVLPFALLPEVTTNWLIPLIVMLAAYPLMSLDQIGVELQNPFVTNNLSHLPLDDISNTIERNLEAVARIKRSRHQPPEGPSLD